MPKFIKRPAAIEAWEWTEAMDRGREPWPPTPVIREGSNKPIIRTLEGDMIVSVGDMIIKGVNGEFYPCKPDIFKKTYYTEAEYAALGL